MNQVYYGLELGRNAIRVWESLKSVCRQFYNNNNKSTINIINFYDSHIFYTSYKVVGESDMKEMIYCKEKICGSIGSDLWKGDRLASFKFLWAPVCQEWRINSGSELPSPTGNIVKLAIQQWKRGNYKKQVCNYTLRYPSDSNEWDP